MSDLKKREIEELGYYKGEHAIPGIKFRYAAKELGVTAWGMNVIELEGGVTGYPEHDHLKDGQEEVYVVLQGDATLVAGEERVALRPGSMVRVGPAVKRKLLPGTKGATILALGATPGKAYFETKEKK